MTAARTEPPVVTPAQARTRTPASLLGPLFARYGTLLAFAAVFAFFSLKSDVFLTGDNWRSIFSLGSVIMVMAAVLTVPLIMGDFDLSVGYHVQLLGAFIVVMLAEHGMATGLGVVLTLLLGAGIGLVLGLVISYSRVSAFVITLGAGTIMLGVELRITDNGKNIFENIPGSFTALANDTFLTLQMPVWISLAVLLALWFLTEHTVLGRYMAAIGGNQEAARLGGVNVELARTAGFVIVGLGAALAGIILFAQSGQYYAGAAVGNLLPAYAGAFIGAATLRSGQFHILGTFVGVLFMQMIQTGLQLLNYQAYISNILQGAVLVVAVLLSRLGAGRR